MSEAPFNIRRYTPSGTFSPAGVLLTLLVGIVIVVPLAFVYCLATFHIPFVYVNFLFTLLFGLLTGLIVIAGVKRFEIRNAKVAGFMGFVLFVVAYAAHWPAYVAVLLADWEFEEPFNLKLIAQIALDLVRDPEMLVELVKDINSSGVWSIGKSSKSVVKGLFLAGIWAAEALAILCLAVSTPVERVRRPYSERKGEWIQPEEMPLPISRIESKEAFLGAMSRRDYSALTTPLSEEADAASAFATVTLYRGDMESYATVTNVNIKRDKKGKEKDVKKKALIEYMAVDNTTADNIRTKLSWSAAIDRIGNGEKAENAPGSEIGESDE